MAYNDYMQARKLGQRVQQLRTAENASPYLPALEDIAEKANGLPRVSLGLIQIPVERIRGTFTKARMNAFAENFMPILDPKTEFGLKWAKLYDEIERDGVLHPIKVVEYRNFYYVIEGNKRVSVMKYLGTDFCEAEVTRIIAPYTDDREGRIYAAYLKWYRDTGLNVIYFSQEGSFEQLYALTGHEKGVKWTEDERRDLRAAYLRFDGEYKKLYAERIAVEAGDAFLLYLKIYGYDPDRLPAEILDGLKKLKGEYEKDERREKVALIMEPGQQKSGGILGALFAPSVVKAAFLYHRPPRESGWNYWHDLGRVNAEQELGEKLEPTVQVCMDQDEFEPAMEKLIAEGNRIIFATSPLMLSATIRMSLKYPEVHILNCSLLASYYHVRSYYLRIFEAKFLIGMIAGAMADNNEIGYITDYPIYGVPSSINAFALGARMVNPRARIHLEWSSKADFDPADPFPEQNVSIISTRDISAPQHTEKEYGLYRIEEDGSRTKLAMPIWDWSKFYIPILRSVLSGSFGSDAEGRFALDYWWGMSSGALDVITSTKFDPYLNRLVDTVHEQMKAGSFWPFEGLLVSQDGTVRCNEGEQLSPADIIAMDWLLDNVVGSFPQTEELAERFRHIVEMQGILEIPKVDPGTINWKE